ncbi:MAG: hypothetical protein Q7R73_01130 [bacterium]|nr:hypothetical protein [bacterium]
MRSVVRKGIRALFMALFLCVTLVTPSFAASGEIHWYDYWFDSPGLIQGPYLCFEQGKELFGDFGLDKLTSNEFKEETYKLVGYGNPFMLKFLFMCSAHNIFSLSERNLLMTRALWVYVGQRHYYNNNDKEFLRILVGVASQLESRSLGIPGGL